ncbi:MAG TPA: ATP-dependent helicase [Candidatus Saccharimonadales bacterium]
MNNILNELNAEQHAAATAADGPLSIVAGPGTGKTKTLTARIVQLVEGQNVLPQAILALTFTNKAARAMQVRVATALNLAGDTPEPATHHGVMISGHPKENVPRITTFHGLCYELLGDGDPLQIISEAERLELLRDLRSQAAAELPLREIAAKISLAKNATNGSEDSTISALLQKYNAALRDQNRFDFDDLLQELYAKLLNDETFKAKVQSRWRYILVDEFQDTNELQYALLKLLASHDNFFVIGDPLQSIYGFRGATGDIFKRFSEDFPKSREITLTTNYRSAPQIVMASNELFKDAPKLTAYNQTPGTVEVVQVLNEYREAEWIVQCIEADLGGTDFQRSHKVSGNERSRKFSDYAVLYRTHRVARALKRAFAESGIPFQSVGDDSPYTQKRLRIAVAALRFVTFGFDDLPPAEKRLLAKFPRTKLAALQEFHASVPTKFLAEAVRELALIKEDDANAMREFHQTLGALVRFDDLAPEAFLMKFDELAEEEFFDARADAVTLLTIHAAKGLEFAHVFVIAAEDGVLPHAPKNGAPNLGEEKRLLYVAMTRAREHLTILHARTRAGQPAKLSNFIDGIPTAVLPRTLDVNLKTQTIAAQKRKAKNAQIGLF